MIRASIAILSTILICFFLRFDPAFGGQESPDPKAHGLETSGSEASGSEATASEWTPLFNGKDLAGWIPKISGQPLGADPWKTVRVEDGLLRIGYESYEGPFANRFLHLFHERPYDRYRLRVVYRFHGEQCPDGPGWAWRNSGVMLHCQDPKTMTLEQHFPVSIEGQFLGGDGTNPRPTGNLCTPGTNVVIKGGLELAHCINSKSTTCHGDGWVTAEFEVDGAGEVRHFIDGKLVLAYEQPQLDPRDSDARSLIKDGPLLIDRGWIALQGESHPVDFKEVSIRLLPERGAVDSE